MTKMTEKYVENNVRSHVFMCFVTTRFSLELFYLFVMCLCVVICLCVYLIQDYWIFGLEGYFSHFYTKGYFGHLASKGNLVILLRRLFLGF